MTRITDRLEPKFSNLIDFLTNLLTITYSRSFSYIIPLVIPLNLLHEIDSIIEMSR